MKSKESILHDLNKKQCYLCMTIDDDPSVKTGTEVHHIFEGWANRKLSEEHGLKVRLCQRHHRGDQFGSKFAVHRPDLNDYADFLHKEGQAAWMKKRMKETFCTKQQAEKMFREIFGKSYIDLEDWEP